MFPFIELRHRRLRENIRFGQDRCMEIGALVDPVLRRQEGNVFYADHLSTEGLKKQFSWDKNFDFDRLVDVDFVWDNKQPLKECVDGQFDYVVASHVAEHVPNLIGWIDQIRRVLTPNGQLRLVFPDGRYSFDMKRQESRLADLLSAWMKKSCCPDTSLVLDFALNKINDQLVCDMHGQYGADLDASELEGEIPVWQALEWGERTLDPNHYEDVHCWVLHLNLFAKLMLPLAKNDILRMSCVQWFDIDPSISCYEFMAFLSPEEDREKRVASWEAVYNQTKKMSSNQRPHEDLHEENTRLNHELRSVYQSNSWHVTKPLRAMMRLLKR